MNSSPDLLAFALALALGVIALLLSDRFRPTEARRRKARSDRSPEEANATRPASRRLEEERLTTELEAVIGAYNAETTRERHLPRPEFDRALAATLFQKLELVAAVVRSCGHRAQVTRAAGRDGEVIRLEIHVADLPPGQPPPYIEFSPAPASDRLHIVYGGVVRGPQVQDGWDAETGWYEVDEDAAEKSLLAFIERVFETNSAWAPIA